MPRSERVDVGSTPAAPATKMCGKCKLDKPCADFAKNTRKRDGLQAFCRSCKKLVDAEYHRTGRDMEKWAAQKLARREQVQSYLVQYLRSHPCVDCGETDIVVLDFDHVTGVKITDVGAMLSQGWGLDAIKTEITKCEVRCANDHRRVTAQRAGTWRALIES